MSVIGVGQNYYRNNVATAKSTKGVNSTEKAINADIKNEGAVSASRQMEPEYANYTKEALVKDTEKDQTTFPTFNALSKLEKYFEALSEHYSKVNKENKKIANPEQHISDKYFNKKSPYYVKGLTQKEREICAMQERRVLMGMQPDLCANDPVIRENFGGCNTFVVDMEWNQEIRNEMNDAINRALEENGIVIPKDADLKLTVDSYDFFIHASGVDEELAKRIEVALNQGRNGYYLYEHISFCDPVNYGVEQQGGHSLHFQERDGGLGLKIQIPPEPEEKRRRGIFHAGNSAVCEEKSKSIGKIKRYREKSKSVQKIKRYQEKIKKCKEKSNCIKDSVYIEM